MTLWFEVVQRAHPGLDIEIEGDTGPMRQIAPSRFEVPLMPLTRPLTKVELDVARKHRGFVPSQARVATQAIAIYVHKDNPLESLTLRQLAALFRSGSAVRTWGDLGMDGAWRDRPIRLHGRHEASTAAQVFRARAMRGGAFRKDVNIGSGTSGVVAHISKDAAAIGYGSVGFASRFVRVVPLRHDRKLLAPATRGGRTEGYPLNIDIWLVVNQKRGAFEPATVELLRLIASRQGQAIVAKDRMLPLRASEAQAALVAWGLARK